MTIKPIETEYAGHRFRSRLEARWAVFFDTLGVEWQYEAEGYEIDGRRYLPDFLLPKQRAFVEVKGDPEQLDPRLLAALASDAGHHVLMLGPIPDVLPGAVPMHSMFVPVWDYRLTSAPPKLVGDASAAIEKLEDPADRKTVWDFIKHESRRAGGTVVCQSFFFVPSKDGFWPMAVGPSNMFTSSAEILAPAPLCRIAAKPAIEAAYDAARKARFEHGEKPA